MTRSYSQITLFMYFIALYILLFLTNTAASANTDSNNHIVNVANTTPSEYVWDVLQAGKDVYIDRSYSYSQIPANYAGFAYLKTANNDKKSTGDSYLSFNIDQPVTVYVAYCSARVSRLPPWLQAWQDTGDQIVTTDRTLYVYKRDFDAGTVILGGNGGVASMYTVILGAQSSNGGDTGGGDTGGGDTGGGDTGGGDTGGGDTGGGDTGGGDTGGGDTGGGDTGGGDTNTQINVANTAPSEYVWDVLEAGKDVYIDRAYSYSQIPGDYAGFAYLKTANNDKKSTGDSYLSFNIDQPVTVYVAYCGAKVSRLPSWLQDWQDTGDQIVTTDRTLYVYKRDFDADTVLLGGNGGAASMYTVILGAQVNNGGDTGGGDPGGGLGAVTLTWTPPTTNVNETPLGEELAGYKIHYGTSPENYNNVIDVRTPGVATYVIDNLSPGSWYFVVTAYNIAGNESEYSNIASKTIEP